MPIELNCQSCGQTLRVADTHAGKRARCPKCQHVNQVPADGLAPLSTSPQPLFSEPVSQPLSFPSATTTAEMWELKLEDHQIYGPVARDELNHWFEEGRISPRSQLRSNRTNAWIWAGEVFTTLGIPLPTKTAVAPAQPATPNLFADHPNSNANPYAAPQSTQYSNYSGPSGSSQGWQKPHRGALVLVLGICGVVICGLISPFAVILGHQDLSEMNAGRMDPEGRGLTIAGVVLGWIVTVPLLFGLLFIFIVILAGAMHG